jgi:hypothetical protein
MLKDILRDNITINYTLKGKDNINIYLRMIGCEEYRWIVVAAV